MIYRAITPYLQELTQQYPVITLTGPRQAGKTTLVETLFPDKPFVSLEKLDDREFALQDPQAFLAKYPEGVIIDEAQYAPDLFSYIQVLVDKSKRVGEFILTGSQNFLLMEKITQSLAGRAAIAYLLPLSYEELRETQDFVDPFSLIFKGFYPRLYDRGLNPTELYKNYLKTYLERDVRQLKNITDLSKFQLFIKLCAGRIGQLLNISSLATDCSVDQMTIKAWLSVLETSFILFLLRPHHKNFNKRLVKQPKLYFYDTGLASYLLGIEKPEELITHYAKGALFENFIMIELIKKRFNQGKESNLYFWRDNHGHELDVIMEQGEKLTPLEIKSGKTITSEFFKGIEYWKRLKPDSNGYLVYAGENDQLRSGIQVLGWKDLSKINF